MKFATLASASAASLALFSAPATLCAQMADAPETPASPEIPMPPASPNPQTPPVEVPAQPTVPDMPPEHVAMTPVTASAYPPCSAILNDQCAEMPVGVARKTAQPTTMRMHRRHHKH
jgi:hypothetical protein